MASMAKTRKRMTWRRRRNPLDDLRLKIIEWMADVTDSRSIAVFAEDNYVTADQLVPILKDKELIARIQEAMSGKKEVTRFLLMKRAFAKASTGNMQATKLYQDLSGESMKEAKGWQQKDGYQELEKMSEKQLDREIVRRVRELKHVGEGALYKLGKSLLRGGRAHTVRRRRVVSLEDDPAGSPV